MGSELAQDGEVENLAECFDEDIDSEINVFGTFTTQPDGNCVEWQKSDLDFFYLEGDLPGLYSKPVCLPVIASIQSNKGETGLLLDGMKAPDSTNQQIGTLKDQLKLVTFHR